MQQEIARLPAIRLEFYSIQGEIVYSYDNTGFRFILLPTGERIDYEYDIKGNLLRIIYP